VRPVIGKTGCGRRGGFSLVELLVVIGIIAILIGLLLPVMQRVKLHARCVACMSNTRQIGQAMQSYAAMNRGWLFPPDQGLDVPLNERWFLPVLKPPLPRDQTSTAPND